MRRKSTRQYRELQLRNHSFRSTPNLQSEVYTLLDSFLHPLMQSQQTYIARIMVGRGLQSKQFINGMHQLKYHTIEYLKQMGYDWKYAPLHEGGDGVIEVEV